MMHKKMSDNLIRLEEALSAYLRRNSLAATEFRAVLFDMDGVLYDSMPRHARAWKQVCDEAGIEASEEEFFAYEGRTGASTIDLLIRRQHGRPATEDECRELYRRKTEFFAEMPDAPVMHGAREAVAISTDAGAKTVLVTGSGQGTLLGRLDEDYAGAFPCERRVTAYDVRKGKPDPEPYIAGLVKAGATPTMAIGIDNAPLGVESSSRAGLFTIGVRTGPIASGALREAGADIEVNSMEECAVILRECLYLTL